MGGGGGGGGVNDLLRMCFVLGSDHEFASA